MRLIWSFHTTLRVKTARTLSLLPVTSPHATNYENYFTHELCNKVIIEYFTHLKCIAKPPLKYQCSKTAMLNN